MSLCSIPLTFRDSNSQVHTRFHTVFLCNMKSIENNMERAPHPRLRIVVISTWPIPSPYKLIWLMEADFPGGLVRVDDDDHTFARKEKASFSSLA